MAPELLKAHLSVKPSVAGIFDMRTGRYLTEADNIAPLGVRTPPKKPSTFHLTDQNSLASTSSDHRTRPSANRVAQDNAPSANEADLQSNPLPKSAQEETGNQRHPSRKSTRVSTPNTSCLTAKRKASKPLLPSDLPSGSKFDQLAPSTEDKEPSHSGDQPSSSITRAKPSAGLKSKLDTN